jgi:CRISPR-associated protein Cas1
LLIQTEDGKEKVPIEQIDSVVVHGYGQVSTQALHLCSYRGVAVSWLSFGGRFVAGTSASPGRVQQRIRQYRALSGTAVCLELSRRTVSCKGRISTSVSFASIPWEFNESAGCARVARPNS